MNRNDKYIPIFEIDEEIIKLISKIINKINGVKINTNTTHLYLRKKNRLMSLQSTLAIENNSLSLKQVTDIVNGKRVLGKVREIKEVQNIFQAYKSIGHYDVYNIEDLLKAHRLITSELVSREGVFRNRDVGVIDSKGNVIHMGARPEYLKREMDNLFLWLKNSKTHPIIKSCVLHFEIEFIHPFEDGNGRIGRLWQTVLLSKYNKIFEYMPIETMIHSHQRKYYEVLNVCSKSYDSTEFIKFMLNIILKSIEIYNVNLNEIEESIIILIKKDKKININELSLKVNKSIKTINRYIKRLKENNTITRVGSDRNGYWQIL